MKRIDWPFENIRWRILISLFLDLKLPKLITLINPNHPASIFVSKKIGTSYEKTTTIGGNTALVYSIKNPNR